MTEPGYAAVGGAFEGVGTTCRPLCTTDEDCDDSDVHTVDTCDPGDPAATPFGCANAGPIPTVSEWGLLVMTLLILTAGTVVLMRRRAVTAC